MTAAIILFAWTRCLQRISTASGLVLLLLPMCITGRALLTGRVYGPIDLPFMAEPLHSLAQHYGVASPHNAVLSDVYTQMIPWQQAVRESWRAGVWPLFNRYILCGDVLAGAMQPAPYDIFNLLSLLISAPAALTWSATITFFIAAFSMFGFARTLGLREHASLIAAAVWMFSAMLAFFVEWPLSRAWAYLPLILAAVRFIVHRPSLRSAALLTTSFVLLILTGHPETLLHITAIGALYGGFELLFAQKRAAPLSVALVGGVLALLLTAFALLPFLEAAPQTHDYGVRTGIYKHTTWPAMPDVVKRRTASSFLPSWGGQPWRGTMTADFDANNWRTGSIALALALLALVWAARQRETWFFAALAILSAWAGANALPIARILHALPLFDVVLNERLAYAAACSLALLAGIATNNWPSSTRARIAGVIVLAFAATAPFLVVRDRLVFIEAVSLAVIAFLLALRVRAGIALPIICAVILLERTAVDGGMVPTLPREAFFPDAPALGSIPRHAREPFRIAGLNYTLIPNDATMYGLEDARGYEAMTLERLYQTYPLWSTPQIASFNVITDPTRPFLSFLNIRYFIDGTSVTVNRGALPRAFVPRHIRFEQSALPGMLQASDFLDTAWIEVPEQRQAMFDNARGNATTVCAANGLDLDVTMDGDGWVIVSEAAWQGWRAYIDNRRIQWRYANHAFLGIYVPKGAHRVTLRYLPDSFVRGRTISLATLIVVAVLLLFYRRRQKTTPFSSSAGV